MSVGRTTLRESQTSERQSQRPGGKGGVEGGVWGRGVLWGSHWTPGDRVRQLARSRQGAAARAMSVENGGGGRSGRLVRLSDRPIVRSSDCPTICSSASDYPLIRSSDRLTV